MGLGLLKAGQILFKYRKILQKKKKKTNYIYLTFILMEGEEEIRLKKMKQHGNGLGTKDNPLWTGRCRERQDCKEQKKKTQYALYCSADYCTG